MLAIVITGASSGVGAALARLLAAGGHALYLTGRNADALERVGADCRALGACGVQLGVGDVASSGDVRAAWAAWGAPQIDVLCANAGLNRTGAVDALTEAEYDEIMGTNVKGAWLWLRQVLPGMRERRRGQVIVTSSVLGLRPPSGGGATLYTASKYALQGLVAASRVELAGSGVKVASVNPGGIASPWWTEPARGGARDNAVDTSTMLPPEAVAEAIAGIIFQHPLCDIDHVVLENARPQQFGGTSLGTAAAASAAPAPQDAAGAPSVAT